MISGKERGLSLPSQRLVFGPRSNSTLPLFSRRKKKAEEEKKKEDERKRWVRVLRSI